MSKMSKSTTNPNCLAVCIERHHHHNHRQADAMRQKYNESIDSTIQNSNRSSSTTITTTRSTRHPTKQNKTTAKVSITSRKCSSISPYRIFILLVIGFPGLNNGKFTLILLFIYQPTIFVSVFLFSDKICQTMHKCLFFR